MEPPVPPSRVEGVEDEPSRTDEGERDRVVTAPEAPPDILPRILAILEKQIEDSNTLQKFILALSERVDAVAAASAEQKVQIGELQAEIAVLEKRLKKAAQKKAKK
jgi:hypothetical protein